MWYIGLTRHLSINALFFKSPVSAAAFQLLVGLAQVYDCRWGGDVGGRGVLPSPSGSQMTKANFLTPSPCQYQIHATSFPSVRNWSTL